MYVAVPASKVLPGHPEDGKWKVNAGVSALLAAEPAPGRVDRLHHTDERCEGGRVAETDTMDVLRNPPHTLIHTYKHTHMFTHTYKHTHTHTHTHAHTHTHTHTHTQVRVGRRGAVC